MGTPTRARKGKAGALPEDSKVRHLLGTGRERRASLGSQAEGLFCFPVTGGRAGAGLEQQIGEGWCTWKQGSGFDAGAGEEARRGVGTRQVRMGVKRL